MSRMSDLENLVSKNLYTYKVNELHVTIKRRNV